MSQVPTEPVAGGDSDQVEQVEPSASAIGHEAIQARVLLPGAGYSMIRVLLNDHPAGTLCVFAQGSELVLRGLVARRLDIGNRVESITLSASVGFRDRWEF